MNSEVLQRRQLCSSFLKKTPTISFCSPNCCKLCNKYRVGWFGFSKECTSQILWELFLNKHSGVGEGKQKKKGKKITGTFGHFWPWLTEGKRKCRETLGELTGRCRMTNHIVQVLSPAPLHNQHCNGNWYLFFPLPTLFPNFASNADRQDKATNCHENLQYLIVVSQFTGL